MLLMNGEGIEAEDERRLVMFVKKLNEIKFNKLHCQKVTNEIKIIRAQ